MAARRWPGKAVAAWLAAAGLVAVSVAGITGCSLLPQQCASQCRYSLTVVFKKGVPAKAAESALTACEHSRAVLKVGTLSTLHYSPSDAPMPGQQGSHFEATITMRTMSVNLGNCLSKQPGFLTASTTAYGPMNGTG